MINSTQNPQNVNNQLDPVVSALLDAMPAPERLAEMSRLQKRLSVLGDLPELRANVLRAWIDVHEIALARGGK